MSHIPASATAEYVTEIRAQIRHMNPLFFFTWQAKNFLDVSSERPETRATLRFHVTICGLSDEASPAAAEAVRAFFVEVQLTQADLYNLRVFEWAKDECGIQVANAQGELAWVVGSEDGVYFEDLTRFLNSLLYDVH